MRVARGWHRIMRSWWWWYDGDDKSRSQRAVSYHADVTMIIWPAWRFNVCKWVGCVPTHGVVRGWRFGLQRTKRATERAIRETRQRAAAAFRATQEQESEK